MKKLSSLFVATAAAFLFIQLFTGCSSSNLSNKKDIPLAMDSSVIQGKLDNGMTYYIRENSEPQNRIVLRLVVKVGSNMEEEDQRGVAHFVEHLAFNGTENFGKSEIINYFEKIGMDFGSDLNAYTNFDTTVYKLEIPADDPEILKTALLILYDWACQISFDPSEIEKERGVVTEEWRLRQGISGRTTDTVTHMLLKDSRYEERLPIGDMDIIHNISRDRILDFYEKWYRPEFMSVVAVGDISEASLEQLIKEILGEIPKSKDSVQLPKYTIPVQEEKSIVVFKDPEQKYEIINFFQPRPDSKIAMTEGDMRNELALEIAREVFQNRISEIINQENSGLLDGFASELAFVKHSDFEYYGIVPNANQFEAALKILLDEVDRMLIFGATKSEVKRVKDSYLANVEQDFKNKDKIKSATHAGLLVDNFLYGDIVISRNDNYRICKSAIEKITLDEINSAFRKYYSDRGTIMFIQAPDSATDIPDEDTLMDIWVNYKNTEVLQAYQDDVDDDILMERPKTKGQIKSQNYISELDVKEYIFDNNVRVLTKKTDFVENQILMYGVSKGGMYKVPEENVPSAKYSVNHMFGSGMNGLTYNQLVKKISSKNADIDISINNTTETIEGSGTNEDFEVALQMTNLVFTKPQFTDAGWNTLMDNINEVAVKHGLQPREVFTDRIRQILYGNDIYSASLTPEYAKQMNAKTSEQEFKNRFANAADFTFIFVGDFEEEKLLELLAYYLGSIETTNKYENQEYKQYDFPAGITTDTVYKGLDAQGTVYIGFGGYAPEENDVEKYYYDRLMCQEFSQLLEMRLREVIREDKSGSYGVGVFGGIEGNQQRSYSFEISFGCEPERAEELKDEVLVQIKKLQTELISKDYVEKLQEALRRGREVNVRNNNWWVNRITNELYYRNEPIWVSQNIEKIAGWLTPQSLQEQAIKYLDTENYVAVYLKPEK